MRFRTVALVASALIWLSAQTSRGEDIITGITIDEVATTLKDSGYRAEVVPDKSVSAGSYIRTGMGGRTVLVMLFNCTGAKCAAIQFWSSYAKSPKFSVAFVEKWNSDIRYAKAHLTTAGGLHVEYDIYLGGGVSAGYIKAATVLYGNLLYRLDEVIRAAPDAATAGTGSMASNIETLVAEGKVNEAVAALDDLATGLWEKAPLTFRRALWVASPPEGFGAYNPRENNVYVSGASMIAYTEPVGFGWRQAGDIYQTDLSIEIVVKDKAGNELLRQADFGGIKQDSRVRNREFMGRFTYRFSGIPQGEYVLDTIMHDKISGKSGAFSLPFVVR